MRAAFWACVFLRALAFACILCLCGPCSRNRWASPRWFLGRALRASREMNTPIATKATSRPPKMMYSVVLPPRSLEMLSFDLAGVAVGSGEVVSAHAALRLRVADERFDGGTVAQLAFDRLGDAASPAGR